MRIIVGISGATGIIYGIRLLEVLRETGVETHLVMSRWAKETLAMETDYSPEYLYHLAGKHYEYDNMSAAISSGSFRAGGMVIAPCSMKTLAGIAHGYGDNLLQRAADVTIKEKRKLILVPRETPLNAIHLENMLRLSQAGTVIMPPMPAFYNKPQTIAELVDHLVGRILDHLGIENDLAKRWSS